MRLPRLLLLLVAVLGAPGCHTLILPYGDVDPVAVEKVLVEVSRLRSLPAATPVRVRVISASSVKREVDADLAREVASGSVERQRKAWARIGLIDGDTDLARAYAQQYSEAPGGYYEQGALKLIRREAVRSEVGELIGLIRGRDPIYGEGIAHELTHALQDQAFDIDRFSDAARDEDGRAARRAIVEGDASKVGYAYGGLFGGSDFGAYIAWVERRLPAINADDPTPLYLRESFQFPYIYGARFAEALWRAGGWARVDSAYRDAPSSTEQILHPEKYLAVRRDEPVAIPGQDCASALGAGWKRFYSTTLGELGVWLWMTRLLGGEATTARGVASGWGGDRADVFESDAATAFLWRSTWDSDGEAREFEAAMARVPTALTGPRRVERRGARVDVVFGEGDQRALLACGWR